MFVPVAEISIFLPGTGLPNWSFKVTVSVVPKISSTDIVVGKAETVDTVADTTPAVKVTVAVLVKAIVSVTSVAERVLASALVDFIVPVTTPLVFVAAAG